MIKLRELHGIGRIPPISEESRSYAYGRMDQINGENHRNGDDIRSETPVRGSPLGSRTSLRRSSLSQKRLSMPPGVEFYQVRLSAPCRAVWLYLLQVGHH